MTALFPSQVAIADGFAPDYSNLRTRIRELLDALDEPLSNLIKSGDKVFLKPYLKTVQMIPQKPCKSLNLRLFKQYLEFLRITGQ